MNRAKFSVIFNSRLLKLNLMVMATTVVFLIQIYDREPQVRSQTSTSTPQASKIEHPQNITWPILLIPIGLAGCLGLALFDRKRRKPISKEANLDEDNYFG